MSADVSADAGLAYLISLAAMADTSTLSGPAAAGASQQAFGRSEWVSKRNCALSPSQLGALFALPGAASLAIAAFFTLAGAWWVLVFAVVEVLALMLAFVVYARHAGAYERLSISADRLIVEFHSGSQTFQAEFHPGWTQIVFPCAKIAGFENDALVGVSAGGQVLGVGRFVPGPERAALAARIRAQLQAVGRPAADRI